MEVKKEWGRNRFAVIRKHLPNGSESVDIDTVEFSAGLSLQKGLQTDADMPQWSAENPMVALVEVRITPVEVVSFEDAQADLDRMNVRLKRG